MTVALGVFIAVSYMQVAGLGQDPAASIEVVDDEQERAALGLALTDDGDRNAVGGTAADMGHHPKVGRQSVVGHGGPPGGIPCASAAPTASLQVPGEGARFNPHVEAGRPVVVVSAE